MKTVGEHIEDWLAELGADGLCNVYEDCGCQMADLFTQVGCNPVDCVPAKWAKCPCGHEILVPLTARSEVCPDCGSEFEIKEHRNAHDV